MKIKSLLAIVLLGCLLLPLTAAEKKGKRIVYIGDSITDGNWACLNGKKSSDRKHKEWDKNHVFGSGYMYLCAAHYMATEPEKEYEFFNRGISGHELVELEDRWQEDVIDMNPDVLSVLVGINDVQTHLSRHPGEPFDIEGWEKRYRKLLDQALQANPNLKIVLCTPFLFRAGGFDKENYPEREKMVYQCIAVIEKLAKEYQIVCVPYHKLFNDLVKKYPNTPNTYWLWDGCHPTPAAHSYMSKLWIKLANKAGYMK
jgi:lysophospholipase L1-like esterase